MSLIREQGPGGTQGAAGAGTTSSVKISGGKNGPRNRRSGGRPPGAARNGGRGSVPPGRGPGAALAWYVVRRLLTIAVLLVVLSFLIFCLMYLAPGDIAHNLLGTKAATPEALANIRAQYHLDRPFFVQYWDWLVSALRGDFGTSIRTGLPVNQEVGSRLGLTSGLVALAFVIAVIVAVPIGIVAARKRGSLLDRALVTTVVVGVSAPGFAVGLVLLFLFAVTLRWFPVYGTGTGFWDQTWHLVLPAVALAIGLGAFISQLTRTAIAAQLDQDYVTFLRARGVAEFRVVLTALRNAAIPIVTSLGLVVTYLVGGTLLVEATFSLPGLGNYLKDAVLFKDVPVVQAVTLLVAAVVCAVSLIVDLLYLALDPRLLRKVTVR